MTGERQIPGSIRDGWAFDPTQPLPQRSDVVIIGGGIVGASAAWFLAKQGVSTVVLEKGRVAGEQSGRNWGWVRQQGRSPLELPLMIRSMEIWKSLATEAGDDAGFVQGGCLYLAGNEDALAEHAKFLPIAKEHGLDTQLLGQQALNTVLENGSRRWHGALYTPSDGRAEPNRAAPVIARAAERAGARIVTHCAVRSIESSAGSISGVVTEHGRIAASTVVCAAGAWTSSLCRTLGVTVPQLRLKGSVARTAPTVKITNGTAFAPRVAIRRRSDGGYTVAHGAALEHFVCADTLRFAPKFMKAFLQEHGAVRLRVSPGADNDVSTAASPEATRVLAPPPSAGILTEIQAALASDFPDIASAPIEETWAGVIEASPDVLPVISAVAESKGFYIATGFSGHGFGIGPAAGEAVAELVRGRSGACAMQAFRLARFSDGSEIRPGPSV
ncbi:MAG: FAD-binding oxidoreductase [Gammaproteobacteria bacterium]|nr:FAD-binding oxidoreductase [Gammaproteobacteria bacterium]